MRAAERRRGGASRMARADSRLLSQAIGTWAPSVSKRLAQGVYSTVLDAITGRGAGLELAPTQQPAPAPLR